MDLIFNIIFVFFLISIVYASESKNDGIKCPGSTAFFNAGCKMRIYMKEECDIIYDEIVKERLENDNWIDPHNQGTYKIIDQSFSNSYLLLSRETGTGSWKKYIDKIALTFINYTTTTNNNNNNGHGYGCVIEACSESQSNSILDHSTNYCNIHDLYCNDKECQPHSILHYTEELVKCNQHHLLSCY